MRRATGGEYKPIMKLNTKGDIILEDIEEKEDDDDPEKEDILQLDEKDKASLNKVFGIWGEDKEVIREEKDKARKKALDDGTKKEIDFISEGVKKKAKKWETKAQKRVKERRYVIDPRAKWKLYWDVLCGVLIIYSVIVIPFRLFFERPEATGFSFAFDWTIDALFLIDMIFSFKTGYMSKHGHLVMAPRRIMHSYLRTWFIVDFFSTIPFDTIINALFKLPKSQLRTIKLIRILRLFRLAKLAKLVSRGSLQLLLAMINPAVLRLVNLIVSIMFVAHFLACFWAAVNECDYNPDQTLYDMEGPVAPGSLISKCGNSNGVTSIWFSQYLAAFYWVIATMMAVGYGDIYGANKKERLYAIFVEIVGAGCFGFIISTTTQIVETMSPETRIRKNELELILEYSKYRNFPKTLHRRLMKHFEYMYTQKSVFDELAVLRQLPVHMRVDLTLSVHESKVEKLQKLFDGLDSHFVAEILLVLRPFFLNVGETIRVDNVVPDQVILVNMGYLQVLRPLDGHWVISGLMREGSVLGMSCAMKNEPMDFMLCAPIATDLWFIETHELKMILDYYAEDTAHLISTNNELHVIEEDCWASETTEVSGVKVKSKIYIDGTATDVADVDHALLAGATELANDKNSKKKNKSLVKTLREDPKDLTKHIMSLETAQDIMERRIVDPGTKRKTVWDVAVGLLIVFSVAVVPLRLGFSIEATKPWLIIDWITDSIFVVDILITFRTAYIDDNNVLVTIPAMIKSRYLRSWFIIDFGSTVPIDKIVGLLLSRNEEDGVLGTLSNATTASSSEGGGGAGGDLRSLKLIRIARLIRLFKLAKLLKIDTSAVEEVIEIDQTVSKTLKLFGILFGLAHFFGCFWNMSTEAEYDELGYPNTTKWVASGSGSFVPLSDSYVEALYWAFTTMTTVGYGDILPEEDNGRLYATVMMIMGATLFSYIVGSASTIITNERSGDKQVKEKLLGLYNYCVDRGISKPLEKRLKRNLDYSLSQKTPFEEQYILDCLPSHLRSEVVMSSKKDAMDKICIFSKGRNMSFVSCVMQYFLPCQFVQQDILYHPLVGSRGLYFILKGKICKVLYQSQSKGLPVENDTSLHVVGLPYVEHEFIGFDAVAVHEDEDKFGALCLEACQCYYLSNEALTLILMRHPAVADTLVQSIREEGLEMHERRKAKAKSMTKGDMAVMKAENNDMEAVTSLLEKEGLAWLNKDAFSKFVARHSRANPRHHDEKDELSSSEIVKPLFQNNDKAVSDEIQSIGKIGGNRRTQVHEVESTSSIFASGSKRDLSKAVKRKSINVSISTNIIDMALKHDSGAIGESDDIYTRGRMLSGGFVVHPDAHEDDDHESHTIVQMAITKAARRVTSNDPLMGTHSPGTHGMQRSNPFAMKHSTVMRPSGRPEKHGLQHMSKKRSETFLGDMAALKESNHNSSLMSNELSSFEEAKSSVSFSAASEEGAGGSSPNASTRSLDRKGSFTTMRRSTNRSRRQSRISSSLVLEGLNRKDIENEVSSLEGE